MDIAILIIRVVFGLAIAAHGAGKLFRFAGHGLRATGGMFEMVGFRPGVPFAAAAGLTEFGGGVLVTIGLLTPFGAAGIVSTMIVAMMSMHVKNGFFAMNNGIELPFLYAVAAVAVAFSRRRSFFFGRSCGSRILARTVCPYECACARRFWRCGRTEFAPYWRLCSIEVVNASW